MTTAIQGSLPLGTVGSVWGGAYFLDLLQVLKMMLFDFTFKGRLLTRGGVRFIFAGLFFEKTFCRTEKTFSWKDNVPKIEKCSVDKKVYKQTLWLTSE